MFSFKVIYRVRKSHYQRRRFPSEWKSLGIAERTMSHFEKAVAETSGEVLSELTKAALIRFYETAVHDHKLNRVMIAKIYDELWDICSKTIKECPNNRTGCSFIFQDILRDVRRWISEKVHDFISDNANYPTVGEYLENSVTVLLENLQVTFQNIPRIIEENTDRLWERQLRSFFIADLMIPAVLDIAGCVYEHRLTDPHIRVMERAVLNALEEMWERAINANALSTETKGEVGFIWRLICQRTQTITVENNRLICDTLDRLYQSYQDIARNKYHLELDKFIDLIREKQMRNTFVHFKEIIKKYRHTRHSSCSYLDGFLSTKENQSLKRALDKQKEVQLLSTAFQSCWNFLQLKDIER